VIEFNVISHLYKQWFVGPTFRLCYSARLHTISGSGFVSPGLRCCTADCSTDLRTNTFCMSNHCGRRGRTKRREKRKIQFFMCLRLCLWKLTSVIAWAWKWGKTNRICTHHLWASEAFTGFLYKLLYRWCNTASFHTVIRNKLLSDSVCMSGIRFIVRRLVQTGPGSPPVSCQIATSECGGKAASDQI